MTIDPPTPPQSIPTVKTLPPISYLEQEAEVERGKDLVAAVESEIEIKKQSLFSYFLYSLSFTI